MATTIEITDPAVGVALSKNEARFLLALIAIDDFDPTNGCYPSYYKAPETMEIAHSLEKLGLCASVWEAQHVFGVRITNAGRAYFSSFGQRSGVPEDQESVL
jgi:hypothetical protein